MTTVSCGSGISIGNACLSDGGGGVGDDVVLINAVQTITNKTIIDAASNITAQSLWYSTGSISTQAAPTPTVGQVLTATSATTAVWQTPSTGVSEFEYIESLAAVTTTITIGLVGGVVKLNWTTASKPAGTYRIGWSYDWTTMSTTRDFIALILCDNIISAQTRTSVISNAGGNDSDDFAIVGSGNNQRANNSGMFYKTFATPGTHTFEVRFGRSSDGNTAVSMSDARIEIWRVI